MVYFLPSFAYKWKVYFFLQKLQKRLLDMKKLILINNFGIFADKHEIAKIDSRFVVKVFDKSHYDVLLDLQKYA